MIVGKIKVVVVRDDHASGEGVHPDVAVLVAQLRCVEDASDVVPVEGADQAFVAVAQLLAPIFALNGKPAGSPSRR